MSPIELKLYVAMIQDGLFPEPQYLLEGYIADFAFPEVRLLVEADGSEHLREERRQHDRKRDWILRKKGWTVMRFHGSTILSKAGNCSYVIKREIEQRRQAAMAQVRQKEMEHQARNEAVARPFRKIASYFKGKDKKRV